MTFLLLAVCLAAAAFGIPLAVSSAGSNIRKGGASLKDSSADVALREPVRSRGEGRSAG